MKLNRAAIIVIALCVACWMSFPPPQDVGADTYGPGVESSVKRFNVVATTSGDTDLIAAVAGVQFRILSMAVLPQEGAVDVYFENGDNAVLFTAAKPQTLDPLGIDGQAGFVLQPHDGGHFLTDTANEAFIVNLSGDTDTAISGTYVEVQF